MFRLVYSFLVICCLSSCSSIEGTWTNKEDSRSILIISSRLIYELYDSDTIRVTKFVRSETSCNSEYLDKAIKGDFISLIDVDKSCLEITGLTDSVFAYRDTSTGRLNVWNRLKK